MGPPVQRRSTQAIRGTAKSTNDKSNVLDLIKQMYPKATTLADIGIREVKILQTIAESYSVPQRNPVKEATWKRLEAFVNETRASETGTSAIAEVQQRQKEDSKPLYRQITETFEPAPESIWEEIDMSEGDPAHRVCQCATPDSSPFTSKQKPRSGKGCGIKVSLRNGIAQTF
jgi:hypothetical protein